MNNSDGKMTLGVCILIGSFLVPTALYAKESKIVVPVIKPVDIKTEDTHPAKSSSKAAMPQIQKESLRDDAGQKIWASFQEHRRRYRNGELGDDGMWNALGALSNDFGQLTRQQRASIFQTQSALMMKAKQPILASIYAAQALMDAPNPLDDDFKKSWQVLRDVSRKQPIQNLLEIVANKISLGSKTAPAFGSDWNYFVANSLLKQKKLNEALNLFNTVKVTDRYFLTSKFQQAMIDLANSRKSDAITTLKTIIRTSQSSQKKLSQEEYWSMQDHANMALGRIYYEDKKFIESIKHYRLVKRDGSEFYDSLFEQSWALFMAGYPNHALGMIYAVRSPFFKDTFNPEATMLASIVYYWMCRYDDSRSELATFMTKHQQSIDALDKYLSRGITDTNSYYRLFEDTVTGVSSDALSIPRELLVMATQQDNLLFVRDQYAAVIRESQKLEGQGIFGSKDNLDAPKKYLDKWTSALREDIGLRLYAELKALKSDYERLYEQGQFLYVELLMSKKDQLLGKELHSDGKLATLSMNDKIRGWGKKTQSWATDNKQEFWADELGFHIVKVKPMCVAKN